MTKKYEDGFVESDRGDGTGLYFSPPVMDIPADKNYPADAVQCDGCGGHGCATCNNRGWLPSAHPKGRKCYRDACGNSIPPAQVAVYCSNDCALADA